MCRLNSNSQFRNSMLTIQQRKQERLIGNVAPHTNRKEQLKAEELHVVRNQKDTVFRMLFREKKELLEPKEEV